jgi:ABC-type glycerol-3-phosphate transport system substrate-binding protein
MRRVTVLLLLCALVLAACGGAPADTSVADPPKSTAFEKSDNTKINAIVEGWQTAVPAELTNYQIKKESIEQKVYQSTASLQEISDFYHQLTDPSKGWTEVRNMPGLQDGIFLRGYDHGNVSLVVGAFDASQVGGQGVIVYTAKGTK